MEFDIFGLLFRWMHILAAATAIGGTVFLRLALLPSLAELPDEARLKLQGAVRSRWSKVVMASICFLLMSGLYNITVTIRRFDLPDYYLPLFMIKFLLALAIFFVASALVGRSPTFEKIRRNARFWLTLNMVLVIVLVCISGVLRAAKKTEKPTKAERTVSALVSLLATRTVRAHPCSPSAWLGSGRP